MYYIRVSVAINTDSLANDDDGSCVYETFVDTLDINLNEDCILPEQYLEIQVITWLFS